MELVNFKKIREVILLALAVIIDLICVSYMAVSYGYIVVDSPFDRYQFLLLAFNLVQLAAAAMTHRRLTFILLMLSVIQPELKFGNQYHIVLISVILILITHRSDAVRIPARIFGAVAGGFWIVGTVTLLALSGNFATSIHWRVYPSPDSDIAIVVMEDYSFNRCVLSYADYGHVSNTKNVLGRSLIKTGELSRIVKVNNRVEGVDKTDVEWLDFNTVMICGKRYTVPPLSSFDYGAIDTERYAANDTVPLSEALTKEYTAAELSEFFSGVSEYPITPIVNPVTYSAANERYPIEVLRSGGYSVYRVSDGGYFYVFWVTDHTSGNDEPIVYFSAYLSSVQDPKKFDELEIGISTAEDVKRIDPASELVIRTSDCAVSYSFLNEKKLLSIEYSHDCSLNETDRLQDLIVKDIQVVKRSIAPDNMQYSRYSLILPGDFPKD